MYSSSSKARFKVTDPNRELQADYGKNCMFSLYKQRAIHFRRAKRRAKLRLVRLLRKVVKS